MKHILFGLFVFIVGCTPVATYPPVENDVAIVFSGSSNEPIPTIFAKTLSYAHKRFGGMDVIVFNLPESVDSQTYSLVSKKLNGAVPMGSENQVAYHITRLRKRPFRAEADIVFPSTTGQYERATIYLSSSLVDQWEVERDRVWLVPVNTLPLPNYIDDETLKTDERSE